MRQRQLEGMQGESVQPHSRAIASIFAAFAVAHIPGDRMVDPTKMPPDLVTATGLGPGLHEGHTNPVAHEARLKLGYRVDLGSALPLFHWAIDDAGGRRSTAYERQVAFVDASLLERDLEDPGSLGAEGEYEHAARAAIEPVNGVDPLPDGIAGEVEGERGSAVVAPMHGKPGRLVHDDNRIVPIQHSDRRRDLGGSRCKDVAAHL